MVELLKKLCEAPGVSGDEGKVRDLLGKNTFLPMWMK